MQCDDGTNLADRFYWRSNGQLSNYDERQRFSSLILGATRREGEAYNFAELIGKQVIVTLDRKWNPEGYESTLAREHDAMSRGESGR
jgi:hypothetical protein